MKLLSILLLFLVLTGPLLLSACADPNDQYIQGTWDRSDIHLLDYWVFDRGTYLHKSGVQLSSPNLHPVYSLTCQSPFAYLCFVT